jgi:hypothetical protein
MPSSGTCRSSLSRPGGNVTDAIQLKQVIELQRLKKWNYGTASTKFLTPDKLKVGSCSLFDRRFT